MHRRRYLSYVTGVASLGLSGCMGQPAGQSPATPDRTTTDGTTTDAPRVLTAGDVTVTLSEPRVRPSILRTNVHQNVYAVAGKQFLVVDAETERSSLDEAPLSLVADDSPLANEPLLVGRPESERRATLAFPVPVATYDTAAVVLGDDGTGDEWPVPARQVSALGQAPAFEVTSLAAPDSVQHGNTFEASFTVANGGARDARFLAEFGHGLISDTGEVPLEVPAGESRTHTSQIAPPYDSDPDAIPVVLDWGLVRRRVEVAVESEPQPSDLPPKRDDLVLTDVHAVEGTMVKLGAEGTATNTGSEALEACVIVVTGEVGGETFRARATRDRLAPNETWEWDVQFGAEADALGDAAVRNLTTVARAATP